jgi:hypothetical protein
MLRMSLYATSISTSSYFVLTPFDRLREPELLLLFLNVPRLALDLR